MKKSDLFREYARVMDMCEGTGVDPFHCVKVRGARCICRGLVPQPTFVEDPKHYEFALAILEGRPVFKGDRLYFKGLDNSTFAWGGDDSLFDYELTWTRPRTFTLNSEVLPCPYERGETPHWLRISAMDFYFTTEGERNKVRNTIQKILLNAKNS